MLQELIAQVCQELEILPVPSLDERQMLTFSFREDVEVKMQDLRPGVSFYAHICSCPLQRREELFTLLMKANYLGQMTGSSCIGMSGDEKFLTLSSVMPYEIGYRAFREGLEDFLNFLLYWREEIEHFEKRKTLV